MELTYRAEGDYLIPNLALPEGPPVTLGKYALLRKGYLKNFHRTLYLNFLTTGKLNEHLMEIEQAANERMELLTSQMAEKDGVTEQLKADDPMKWVGLMNNIRMAAEEHIRRDLIFG